MQRKLIEECKKAIRHYEEIARQYDELESQVEQLRQQRILREQELDVAQEQVVSSIDQWITELFDVRKTSRQWKPKEEVLKEVEEKIQQYRSVEDAGAVQELLRADYERQRQQLVDVKSDREHELKLQNETLKQAKEELEQVQNQEELEPEREESTRQTRQTLQEAGITAVPFYKTVEFSGEMEPAVCARLEAQLQRMGLLDALVVSPEDFERIRQACPQFLDTILYVEKKGDSRFSGLFVSEELEGGLREAVGRILSNIYEKEGSGQGIYLGKDGSFCQGILAGKADKTGEAEFVGLLARKRRKEEKIRQLQEHIRELTETVSGIEKEIEEIRERLEILQEEYQRLPGFFGINEALAKEKECNLALQMICVQCDQKEAQERSLEQQKNGRYQTMLQQCKPFPYARTREAYEEVSDAIEEYQRIWQEVRENLLQLGTERSNCRYKEEQIADHEQAMDEAFVEKRTCNTRVKECEIQIQQYEAYLNQPEIVEKANRLKEIREELERINEECSQLSQDLVRLDERLSSLLESEPKQKEQLQKAISEEAFLRNYFEEELSLKLVFERGTARFLTVPRKRWA